jgi:hypothetical protein
MPSCSIAVSHLSLGDLQRRSIHLVCVRRGADRMANGTNAKDPWGGTIRHSSGNVYRTTALQSRPVVILFRKSS